IQPCRPGRGHRAAGQGPPMPSSDRARTRAIRRRMAETGEPFSVAARHVDAAHGQDHGQAPGRRRFVLADDVADFFEHQEEGRRWLECERSPRYECRTCEEDGDATVQDTAVEVVLAVADPDLCPAPAVIAVRLHHAACAPGSVNRTHRLDIPAGPTTVGLGSSVRPDMAAELEVSAHPVLIGDPAEDDEGAVAALVLWAEVAEDHGQGAVPWLNELGLVLGGAGFCDGDEAPGLAEEWSVRLVEDYPSPLAPQWLSVRTAPVEPGE